MTRTILLPVLLLGCGPLPHGTEIGDEGPALCFGEGVPVSDADAVLDTLGDTPTALADAVEGDFATSEATLALTVDRAGFTFADVEPTEWQDDTPPPDDWDEVTCYDELWAPADWVLDVPGVSVAWLGDVTWVEDGQVRGSLQALFVDNPGAPDPDDDEGGTDPGLPPYQGELTVDPSAEPVTFVADDMRRVELWVRGTFDGTGWDLEVTWVAETHPQGSDANIWTLEEPVWSGRLEGAR